MKFIRLTAKARKGNVPWIVNPKQIIGVAQAEDAIKSIFRKIANEGINDDDRHNK